MMDPADSVFVGLLALLYSALSAVYCTADAPPADPYRILETASRAARYDPGEAVGCAVERAAVCPSGECRPRRDPALPIPELAIGGLGSTSRARRSPSTPASVPPGEGLQLGEAVILGTMPRERITAWFAAQKPALSVCGAGRSGRVVVKVVIDREGTVLRAVVVSSEEGLDDVGRCVSSRLQEARFSEGPGLFIVKQVLVFGG